MAFTPRRQEQILTDQITRMVARTDLSDVTDASSFKNMLAASSREDDEIYFQMGNVIDMFDIDNATGDDLDARAAEIQPGTIRRIGARVSNGALVFTRTGVAGTLVIAVGQRCKTVDSIVFVTTVAGSITPGNNDSAPISCVSEEPGTASNVVANTVTKFINKPAGVVSVNNPLPMLNGLSKESDDSFRQRIKDFVASLASGTILALEQAVLGLEDTVTGEIVLFSKAVEAIGTLSGATLFIVSILIDNGAGSIESSAVIGGENVTFGLLGPPPDSAVGGEETLFLDEKPIKLFAAFTLSSSTRGVLTDGVEFTLNPASGQLDFSPALVTGEVLTAGYTHYTGLIQEAQKVIDGDVSDRDNYPGVRAGGTLSLVKAPQVLIQTVTAALNVHEGYTQAEGVAAAEVAVANYINALEISNDVVRNEIISRIQSLPEIKDLVLSAPLTNIIILDDQLARTTSANITIV